MGKRVELSVYLSEDQMEKARAAAKRRGLSISSWVRSLILEEARVVLEADATIPRVDEPFEGAAATYDVETRKLRENDPDA